MRRVCPQWDRQSPCPLSQARRQDGKRPLPRCLACPYEAEDYVWRALCQPVWVAADREDLED